MSEPDGFREALREGTRLLKSGNTRLAVALLEKAYALDSKHADAILNLSGAYILVGKHQRAVDILEPLVEANNDNVAIWTNLGAAYLGNPILARDESQLKAIAAFERALELDPAAYSIHYNIGLIYRDRGERGKAIDMFTQAMTVNPDDKDALSQLRKLGKM